MKKRHILGLLVIVILAGCGQNYTKPTTGKTIVAFGDSLTEGYGLDPSEAYPAQLSKLLGEEVINEGVSGDTTADAIERIDDVLEHNPKLVIVFLGGNDALQKIDPSTTFKNLETIIDSFHGKGIGVVLVGVRGGLQNAMYKENFKDLAKKKNIPYTQGALKGIFGKRELMYDTVHPNAEGYGLIAEKIKPAVQEILK